MPILSGVSGNALASALSIAHGVGAWEHGALDGGAGVYVSAAASPIDLRVIAGDCGGDPVCHEIVSTFAADDSAADAQVRMMREGTAWVDRFTGDPALSHFAGATDALVCRVEAVGGPIPVYPAGYAFTLTRLGPSRFDTTLAPSGSVTPPPGADLAVRCVGFDAGGARVGSVLVSYVGASGLVDGSGPVTGTAIVGQ